MKLAALLIATLALLAAAIGAGPTSRPATEPSTHPATRELAATRPATGPSTEPSRITLHYTNAPMTDVIADFSRQAGCDLASHDPAFAQYAAKQRITINIQNGTFWDALQPFLDQGWADLNPQDTQIQLHPPGQIRMMSQLLRFDTHTAALAGPLLICPYRCREFMRFSFNDSAQYSQNAMTLSLRVLTEPKAGIVGVLTQNWLDQCVDEHGNSLLYGNNRGAAMNGKGQMPMMMGQGQFASPNWLWQLQAGLKVPPEGSLKIARMSGSLQIQVAGHFDSISLPVAKIPGYTKTVAGVTLTFKSISPLEHQRICTVEISAERSDQQPLRFASVARLIQSLRLQDDSGAPMESLGAYSQPSGDRSLRIIARFLAMGQPSHGPATLLWSIPVDVKTYTVPFELHDIPLPGPPTDATQPSNPPNN